MKIKCKFCEREYDYDAKAGHTKTQCNSCMVNRRRAGMKAKCIEYKGGRCILCGYDKCERALVFHHRDPTTKKFQICSGHSRSWDSVKAELEKCDLLCANCHAEQHSKEDVYNLDGWQLGSSA